MKFVLLIFVAAYTLLHKCTGTKEIELRKTEQFVLATALLDMDNTTPLGHLALHKEKDTMKYVKAVFYTIPVEIGSGDLGGQKIEMVISTGSPRTWIMQARTGKTYPVGTSIYYPSKSDNYKAVPNSNWSASWILPFEELGITGSGAVDKFTFHTPEVSVTVADAHFDVATVPDEFISRAWIGGVFGLGTFGDLPPTPYKDAVQEGKLPPYFTIALDTDSDTKFGSALTFDHHDLAHCESEPVYEGSPSLNSTRWLVKLDTMQFGEAVLFSDEQLAYPDTGSMYIGAPEAFVEAVASALNATKIDGQCWLALKKVQSTVILGQPFTEEYCQTYNLVSGEIGFAKAKTAE